MIDETSCLQLVMCVKCGSRWRELWQCHWPQREIERVEHVVMKTNRNGMKRVSPGTDLERKNETVGSEN
jgi:hypothetical protein